jgi:aconitate hydratase
MIEPSKTKKNDYCVIAGDNFAQGSSREHAALAPKYLGQKLSFILRSHRLAKLNLTVPFEFKNPDWEKLEQGDVLNIEGLRAAIKNNDLVTATVKGKILKSSSLIRSARDKLKLS